MNMTTTCGEKTAAGVVCGRRIGHVLNNRCWLHEAVRNASYARAEDIKLLRSMLKSVVPYTEAEKKDRSRKGALRTLKYYSETLSREEDRAREAGATDAQISAARLGVIA